MQRLLAVVFPEIPPSSWSKWHPYMPGNFSSKDLLGLALFSFLVQTKPSRCCHLLSQGKMKLLWNGGEQIFLNYCATLACCILKNYPYFLEKSKETYNAKIFQKVCPLFHKLFIYLADLLKRTPPNPAIEKKSHWYDNKCNLHMKTTTFNLYLPTR